MTAENKTQDTLLEAERADTLSDLENLTDRLMNEWDRNDEIPVVSEEFYADLAAFTERWFSAVVDR